MQVILEQIRAETQSRNPRVIKHKLAGNDCRNTPLYTAPEHEHERIEFLKQALYGVQEIFDLDCNEGPHQKIHIYYGGVEKINVVLNELVSSGIGRELSKSAWSRKIPDRRDTSSAMIHRLPEFFSY